MPKQPNGTPGKMLLAPSVKLRLALPAGCKSHVAHRSASVSSIELIFIIVEVNRFRRDGFVDKLVGFRLLVLLPWPGA